MDFNIEGLDVYRFQEIIMITRQYGDLLTYNTKENLVNKLDRIDNPTLGKIREVLELMNLIKDSEDPLHQNMFNTMKNKLEAYVSQL